MLKAFILVCVAAVGHAVGLVAPVGLGHVAYGAPYGAAYGAPYSAAYGAPWGGWNPYSNYPAQPALASQSSNIYRSPFNLGQISTYSKAIDTPFSSVRKSDVRVSNPGIAVAPYATSYASPYLSHVGVAAPVAKVATAGGLLGVAYSAAPAVSHMTYSNGLGLAYSW